MTEDPDYDRLLPDSHTNNTMKRDRPRKRRGFQFALIGIFVIVILLLLSSHLWETSSKGLIETSNVEYSRVHKIISRGNNLPALSIPEIPTNVYQRLCYPSLPHNYSISHIIQKIELMSSSENAACKELAQIFNRIYQISKINGEISLPEEFIPEVKGWLNNNEKLFSGIRSQEIFKVTNVLFGEQSVYNMLRSKRPVSKPSMDPIQYVEELSSSTQPSCDFCKYQQHTAEDVFGRINNPLSASASNTFKLAKFHGLFFPLKHHPLNISFEVLNDLFLNTAQQWVQKAFEVDSTQKFVTMLWDTLPHAGASQVHPHVHGLMDSKQYAGIFGVMNEGTWSYYEKFNRFLWSDILLIHWALGMVVTEGSAHAIVPITARKDNEYMILSDSLNPDAIKLLYRVLQAYRNKLDTYCFSSSSVLPVISAPNSGLPFVYRIGSRGDCTSVRSDVSSLELYSVNNINSDLAKTLNALQTTTF